MDVNSDILRELFHPPNDGWQWDIDVYRHDFDRGWWLIMKRARGIGLQRQFRSERWFVNDMQNYWEPSEMAAVWYNAIDGLMARFTPLPKFRIGTRNKKRLRK